MANAEGINPSRYEVERQLDLLLADEVIASNPNSAKALKYIVERALDGQQVSELDLLNDVFRKPLDVEDTTARVTMDRLRKLIKEYYQGEGQDDPVFIALPDQKKTPAGKRIKFQAGEAYTPYFTYNPTSWIAKELAIAYQLLRGSPTQMNRALAHFGNVDRAVPNHPEVALGLLEHWGMMLLMRMIGPDPALIVGPLRWLAGVEKAIGPNWRTHNVRALLHLVVGERQAAKEEFEKALTFDRQQTIGRGWYLSFLFETGKEEQALRHMAQLAEQSADNAHAHATYAVYLSRAHRYDEAELAFFKALELDRNFWPAHYGLTVMYHALGQQEKVEHHMKRLEELLEPQELEQMRRMPGRGR